jgi:hypothetical protein
LRESAIIPQIPLMREAVPHEPQLALLDILLDRVQQLLFRDLLLGIGPSWDLHNHVQDCLLLISVEWDIMEWGDGDAIFFNEDTVFEGERLADFTDGVGRWGFGVRHCW